jgi:hypothetical protein
LPLAYPFLPAQPKFSAFRIPTSDFCPLSSALSFELYFLIPHSDFRIQT